MELFHLKYRLETELSNKKIFLYFPYEEPNGNKRKTFTLLDLMKANRILLIDPMLKILLKNIILNLISEN